MIFHTCVSGHSRRVVIITENSRNLPKSTENLPKTKLPKINPNPNPKPKYNPNSKSLTLNRTKLVSVRFSILLVFGRFQ